MLFFNLSLTLIILIKLYINKMLFIIFKIKNKKKL